MFAIVFMFILIFLLVLATTFLVAQFIHIQRYVNLIVRIGYVFLVLSFVWNPFYDYMKSDMDKSDNLIINNKLNDLKYGQKAMVQALQSSDFNSFYNRDNDSWLYLNYLEHESPKMAEEQVEFARKIQIVLVGISSALLSVGEYIKMTNKTDVKNASNKIKRRRRISIKTHSAQIYRR